MKYLLNIFNFLYGSEEPYFILCIIYELFVIMSYDDCGFKNKFPTHSPQRGDESGESRRTKGTPSLESEFVFWHRQTSRLNAKGTELKDRRGNAQKGRRGGRTTRKDFT